MLHTICVILVSLCLTGGKLIFDERDVELHAENILIIDNGLLQVRLYYGAFAMPHEDELSIYAFIKHSLDKSSSHVLKHKAEQICSVLCQLTEIIHVFFTYSNLHLAGEFIFRDVDNI